MISEAPGTFSPLEVARNRLAKALFLLCLTIIILAITVDRSANEFAATEKKLANRVSRLEVVRSRLITFLDPDIEYFASRLQSAFDVICLTPEEAGKPQLKPNTRLTFLSFGSPSNLAKNQIFRSQCAPQFVSVLVDQESIWNISAKLTTQLREKQLSPISAITQFAGLVSDKEKELWNLLLAYWGEVGLASLVSERWMDWRSMRGWVLEDREPYWISSSKDKRRHDYGTYSGGWDTYSGSPTRAALGSIYARFDKVPSASETEFEELAVVRVASDSRQALLELERQLKDATQELKAHSPELKWSAVGFGGISVSVLQWLEWMPWLVTALLAVFVSFDQKANSTEGVGTSDFWFPRLGRPRDPLSPPLPVGDRWGPAVFWFCFLTLPAAVCYWGAVMRFQILDWSSIGILVSRGFFAHPADWFNSVAFIACLGLTIQSTSSQDEYEGRNLRVLKLVVWVCFVAAACAALIVAIDQLFVRTDYQGNPSSALWDGQVYLIFLSFAIAWIAIGSMKNLSRFGAFTLFSLAIANYVLVVRTTLA